jgi:hypothetical protein
MGFCHFVALALLASFSPAVRATEWNAASPSALQDDDLARHASEPEYLKDIELSELRFSENGFDWHLLRFTNPARPDGPLWVVPHDDEDVAFDSMVSALRRHGGIGVVVNTGAVGTRRQSGKGVCGVRATITTACDPNRNFDERSPIFTSAILRQRRPGQPVIALHSNSPGFGGDGKGGRGDITMLDAAAYARGARIARADGHFGINSPDILADPDIYAILPYRVGANIRKLNVACRTALNESGVNVWHERVGTSDGSLSNYIATSMGEIVYVNLEVRHEKDLTIGAEAHRLMIDAFLEKC